MVPATNEFSVPSVRWLQLYLLFVAIQEIVRVKVEKA